MAAVVVYPVDAQFSGVAKEVTPGLPVAMTATMLMDTFKWEDKPVWLADKAYRGSMGNDSFNEIEGVYYCDVSALGGPVYPDELGYMGGNILGDITTTATTAPFQHVISLLNPAAGNSYTAQPTAHTWTHYYGPTATSGARQVPSFCLSQLVLTWDNATGMFVWTGKGQGWKSVPAGSRPTVVPGSIKPYAGWSGQLAVGGPLPGSAVLNLEKATFTITRELENEFTGNGVQNPLVIARAGLSATFDLQFIAQDEVYYTDMISNTQPQLQALFSTGAGASLVSVQIDVQQAAFQKVAADYSKKMVRWMVSGKCVFNSTNVGTSGGLAPIQMTLKNAIPSGTYV